MIVKDAVIKLQVADTDVAIDRTTQLASDLGGYIISSRIWYQPSGKRATNTPPWPWACRSTASKKG